MAFSLHFATKIVTNTLEKLHDQRTTNVTNWKSPLWKGFGGICAFWRHTRKLGFQNLSFFYFFYFFSFFFPHILHFLLTKKLPMRYYERFFAKNTIVHTIVHRLKRWLSTSLNDFSILMDFQEMKNQSIYIITRARDYMWKSVCIEC